MRRPGLGGVDALLFIGLGLCLVSSIFSISFLPTHDGPNHLASCVLANRLDTPASPLARWIEPGTALTTQGYQVLCVPMERLLGWRVAHQVLLAAIALAWAAAVAWVVRGISPRSGLALFGLATALQWQLYMGFFNFLIAAIAGLFVLGWVVRREPESLVQWALFSGAMVLVAFAHPFPAAAFGATSALVVLLRAPRGTRERVLLRLALAGAPAFALVLAVRAPDTHAVVWRDLGDRVLDVGRFFTGGPAWRALPPSFLAVAALAAGLVAWVKGSLPSSARGLALGALVAIAAFLASPLHASTWAYFSPRFLAVGMPLAVAVAPPSLFASARGVIASRLVTVALAAASIGWSFQHHARLAPLVGEVFAGLDAPIERTGPRLPLMLSTAGDHSGIAEVEPLVMVLHAYTFDQGGIDPYLFATVPSTDALLYLDAPEELFGNIPQRFPKAVLRCERPEGCLPPEEVRALVAVYGRLFEDVILFADDPGLVDALRARGYTVEFQRGRLAILRPGRCGLRVAIASAPGVTAQSPLVLSIGHAPLESPVVEAEVDPARAIGAVLSMDGPDCGALWMRVTGPRLGCAEADGSGRVPFTATTTAAADVTCTLVQVAAESP